MTVTLIVQCAGYGRPVELTFVSANESVQAAFQIPACLAAVGELTPADEPNKQILRSPCAGAIAEFRHRLQQLIPGLVDMLDDGTITVPT